MTQFGYTLMCEQTDPKSLVRFAARAEQAGFDFAVISDHFHPWLETEGQSPFAWSVLGAVVERTERIRLMTMVTCPFLRYHPAIIAQAAATIGVLSDNRFLLGLGAGENLNEHVVGRGWPSPSVRHRMLEESVEIIGRLWSGGEHSYHGQHLSLDRARLYTLPSAPPGLGIAAGGPGAARLAARLGAALIAVEPNAALVEEYRSAGGTGPCYGQIGLCWAESEAEGQRTARAYQRFALTGWSVMSELPDPEAFGAATQSVREEDVAQVISCGPDPQVHAKAIAAFVEAGFDHIALLQAGPDQGRFLDFFEQELRPLLG